LDANFDTKLASKFFGFFSFQPVKYEIVHDRTVVKTAILDGAGFISRNRTFYRDPSVASQIVGLKAIFVLI